jgi:hypothetical protein
MKKATSSVLACGLCVACVEPEPEPDSCATAVFEGDQVAFVAVDHHFEGYCQSDFEAAESHARWVAEAWGSVGPESIVYRLFQSSDHPCWPCPERFPNCARPGEVVTTRLPHRHELAHAGRMRFCSSLLEEGWAELYSDPFGFYDTPEGSLRDVLETTQMRGYIPINLYPTAQRFVAFVIDNYGMDALTDLCAISIEETVSGYESAFLEILGLDLDAVEAEFNSYPEWTYGQLRQEQACEKATDPLPPTIPASLTFKLDCVGIDGNPGVATSAQALVEIPQAGSYTIYVDASRNMNLHFEFRSCERDGLASTYYTTRYLYPSGTATYADVLFDVPPGVYAVLVKNLKGNDAPEQPNVDSTIKIDIQPYP